MSQRMFVRSNKARIKVSCCWSCLLRLNKYKERSSSTKAFAVDTRRSVELHLSISISKTKKLVWGTYCNHKNIHFSIQKLLNFGQLCINNHLLSCRLDPFFYSLLKGTIHKRCHLWGERKYSKGKSSNIGEIFRIYLGDMRR